MGILERIARWIRRGKGGAVFQSAPGASIENRTLATNETIFAAVTMLANSLASAPVTLRKSYEKVNPSEHPVARLLEYGPNPTMTTFEFIRSLETMRDTTGAGYAIKEMDRRGQVCGLWLMKDQYVTPVIEKDTKTLYYKVTDEETKKNIYFHNEHIIAVRHIGVDGYTPVNPIKVLQNSLEYDREVKQISLDQMKMGMNANLVINFDTDLSDEQIEEYNKAFQRFKRVGVIYLDRYKEIKELTGRDLVDPKVFEAENITVARVARVYTIPLGKLLAQAGKYSDAEQEDLNYIKDAILPLARMYEQEFSAKLLTEEERNGGMAIKMSLNGFARGNMATRGDFYFKGVRSAWFNPNEVRALEDMPPYEGGEEYLISKDLVPLRLLTTPAAAVGEEPGATQTAPPGATGIAGAEIAQVSLNGAQISGILQIVTAVRSGDMDYQAAVRLLVSAFPFSESVAREILGQEKKPEEESA